MTAPELLALLQRQGAVLEARGDRLAYDAPKDVVTPELVEELRAHKRQLLVLLAAAAAEHGPPAPDLGAPTGEGRQGTAGDTGISSGPPAKAAKRPKRPRPATLLPGDVAPAGCTVDGCAHPVAGILPSAEEPGRYDWVCRRGHRLGLAPAELVRRGIPADTAAGAALWEPAGDGWEPLPDGPHTWPVDVEVMAVGGRRYGRWRVPRCPRCGGDLAYPWRAVPDLPAKGSYCARCQRTVWASEGPGEGTGGNADAAL